MCWLRSQLVHTYLVIHVMHSIGVQLHRLVEFAYIIAFCAHVDRSLDILHIRYTSKININQTRTDEEGRAQVRYG